MNHINKAVTRIWVLGLNRHGEGLVCYILSGNPPLILRQSTSSSSFSLIVSLCLEGRGLYSSHPFSSLNPEVFT